MEIRRVGDLMIPLDAYPHIPYWFSLRQAMIVMLKAQLKINETKSLPRAVLIFDKEYRFLGMVRRRDILRGMESEFASISEDQLDDDEYIKLIAKNLKKIAEKQVIEVMIPIKETVDYNDRIPSALNKMVNNEVSMLPVMKEGKVMGVIRTVEMFDEISKLVVEREIRHEL